MRIAVVTGAASGIGHALAQELADEGYRVHVADVAPTAERGPGFVPHLTDVTEEADMEELAQAAPEAELICLNAGIVGTTMGAPWEVPPEEWRRLLDVNLLGVVNGLRAFVPRLREAGRPATILITASLAGVLTFPGGGAYAATKHALVAVAEQTALALTDSPISVAVLCPALVKSGMSEIGEEPADVARNAIAAARDGRFMILPGEWGAAAIERATRFVNGDQPVMPTPGTVA